MAKAKVSAGGKLAKNFTFKPAGSAFGERKHDWDSWLDPQNENGLFLVGGTADEVEAGTADYEVGTKVPPKTKAANFAYAVKLQAWKRGLECQVQVHEQDGNIGVALRVSVPDDPARAEELKAEAKRRTSGKKKAGENGDGDEDETGDEE